MRNPFKTFSFQATFYVSFLAISALLILLLGWTSYYITNQEVVGQTISSRKLLLDEINKQLDMQLQSVEYDSLALASNPKLIHYLQTNEDPFERLGQTSEMIDLLSRPSYVKDGILSLQLYAKHTTGSSHIAGSGVYGYDLLERVSWYDQIKDADYCWVGAHPVEVGDYPEGDRQVVTFARKVLSAAGQEAGVLVVNVKLSYIEKLAFGSKTDASRFILDTNGRLIAQFHGGPVQPVSYDRSSGDIAAIMDKSASDHYAIAPLDMKSLIIWNKQTRTSWVTMDVIPWETITKGSRRIASVILVVVVLCILLTAAMAFLLSVQFAAPIRRLIRAMNAMKVGKLNERIDNDYRNEFGHLNDHFNEMAERIETLIRQVTEQNRRQREAEIQVLQEQINPHFLYNTLDMMNWHAIESGSHDISHMLALLGKMLRIGLSSGATFISVRQEMEHLGCYVELQTIRYKQTIRFELSVPDELKHCYIPKLILQPFVENSLLHGLHGQHTGGTVLITAGEDDQGVYFRIEDNGRGMEAVQSAPGRERGGIRNVNDRIQLYFGERYGVELRSVPGHGTSVTLRVPKLTEEPAPNIRGETA
ncbi:cache domain-containing sensor histidine kinase [Paenibacillus oceani]|uniref:Sensor histidine kinase n=1 Tax=Paenibacillus oceani TaxID=2772510 RepID=A0A927H1W8_9BACL|nr:sensor histidine kinase [Paenibacillus oceani]MBD2864768.1 sensor histidine kinase [Paenibacillus oceani]